MRKNQNPSQTFLEKKEVIFDQTTNLIYEKIFHKKPPKKLSLTLMESMLVGVSANLENLSLKTAQELNDLYISLINEPEFSEDALVEGLAQKRKVTERLNKAVLVFSR